MDSTLEKQRENKRKWARNNPEVLAKAARKQANDYKKLTVRFHKKDDEELIDRLEHYCQKHSITKQDFVKSLIENTLSDN